MIGKDLNKLGINDLYGGIMGLPLFVYDAKTKAYFQIEKVYKKGFHPDYDFKNEICVFEIRSENND